MSKTGMKELLQKTNYGIKQALYQLSRVIDTGDFHIILAPDRQVEVELYSEIPRCFKLNLREFEQYPVVIQIRYHSRQAA